MVVAVVVVAGRVAVAVVVRVTVLVAMCMGVPVIVSMTMVVAVIMFVTMALVPVIMPMMLAINLLRERIVLSEGLVMPVLMPTTISPRLRLKRQRHLLDHRADPLEHIREHRIVFELQIIHSHLNRRMPVAQVISRSRERQPIRAR